MKYKFTHKQLNTATIIDADTDPTLYTSYNESGQYDRKDYVEPKSPTNPVCDLRRLLLGLRCFQNIETKVLCFPYNYAEYAYNTAYIEVHYVRWFQHIDQTGYIQTTNPVTIAALCLDKDFEEVLPQ